MTLQSFITKLKETPNDIAFADTMAVIEENYDFTPTAFKNGDTHNAAGTNSGSCKLFAFAQMQQLTKEETLACFGSYYFDEVLGDPEGDNHQNIRNFMKYGWDGIEFEGIALNFK
ncbi:HopJ type III effector protein [Flavobacterium sp. UMI-01]|uniref:HopJ type III effector protein n=1 Tax=Flavobacterium sp. UMI-01 TaxID=1441053 RepID=UPI001C7DF13B|nr:HopJ type III effector protein [Flavobacterium sp. UMI-01]GIZ09273.1 type III effector [Flavobacterium sp. UMI-01]